MSKKSLISSGQKADHAFFQRPMPREIEKLAQTLLNSPVKVEVTPAPQRWTA
jgi:hypothetical protein